MTLIPRVAVSVFILSSAVACGSGTPVGSDAIDPTLDPEEARLLAEEEAIAESQSAVQWNYGSNYSIVGLGVWNPAVSPAIGMTRTTISPGVTSTCGVTFVTKHFAVTAAHCVPKTRLTVDLNNTVDPGDQTFQVIQVDTSLLSDWAAVSAQSYVSGTWPSYTTGAPLTCLNGYCQSGTYNQCRVRYRCSETYGWENCPPAVKNLNNHEIAGKRGVDIALIHCADRPSTGKWTAVDTGPDATGTNVEAWWYHEVKYMAPDSTDVVAGLQPADNWAHYGFLGADKGQNYHYTGNAQPFLLTSRHWPNGTLYKAIAFDGNYKDLILTDTFGCHGTSGSGVFTSGTAKFLGPYVAGVGPIWANRLCMDVDDPGNATPGTVYAGYVRPSVTRQLETIAKAVAGER